MNATGLGCWLGQAPCWPHVPRLGPRALCHLYPANAWSGRVGPDVAYRISVGPDLCPTPPQPGRVGSEAPYYPSPFRIRFQGPVLPLPGQDLAPGPCTALTWLGLDPAWPCAWNPIHRATGLRAPHRIHEEPCGSVYRSWLLDQAYLLGAEHPWIRWLEIPCILLILYHLCFNRRMLWPLNIMANFVRVVVSTSGSPATASSTGTKPVVQIWPMPCMFDTPVLTMGKVQYWFTTKLFLKPKCFLCSDRSYNLEMFPKRRLRKLGIGSWLLS